MYGIVAVITARPELVLVCPLVLESVLPWEFCSSPC